MPSKLTPPPRRQLEPASPEDIINITKIINKNPSYFKRYKPEGLLLSHYQEALRKRAGGATQPQVKEPLKKEKAEAQGVADENLKTRAVQKVLKELNFDDDVIAMWRVICNTRADGRHDWYYFTPEGKKLKSLQRVKCHAKAEKEDEEVKAAAEVVAAAKGEGKDKGKEESATGKRKKSEDDPVPTLDQWSFVSVVPQSPFADPSNYILKLQGIVTNHPHIEDGNLMTTSPVRYIKGCEGDCSAWTMNDTKYVLLTPHETYVQRMEEEGNKIYYPEGKDLHSCKIESIWR